MSQMQPWTHNRIYQADAILKKNSVVSIEFYGAFLTHISVNIAPIRVNDSPSAPPYLCDSQEKRLIKKSILKRVEKERKKD